MYADCDSNQLGMQTIVLQHDKNYSQNLWSNSPILSSPCHAQSHAPMKQNFDF